MTIPPQRPLAVSALSGRKRLLLAIAAVLPYYTVHAAHFLLHPDATGFIQNDQPYYVANGREIFERGNGFAHPNPFDPDPRAPVIYFHWLTWLYGAAVKFLGTDPAFLPLLLGAIAALALGLLTLAIIECVLPDRQFIVPLFLLAMWGGGVLALGGLLAGGGADQPLFDRLLAFDPESGWWFLNWGRNVMYPTESVYHAIVAATWLALLRGRENWAVLGGAVLAATHPFSGLQLLGFLGFWFTYRLFVVRTWPPAARLGAWVLIVAAFLYYYVVYLNQFPQHVAMQRDWTENPADWVLPLRTMLLAYGPVAVLAIWRLANEPRPWKSEVVLFAGCFCVTLLLIKHDLLVRHAKQPIHFTRGYEWMPLFVLGLPKLQQLFLRVWDDGRIGRKVTFAALLFGLGTLDNLTFIAASWTSEAPIPHYLTRSEREMFAWMEEQHLTGVLLCTDRNLSYLAATYTSVRPYFGHGHNTPDFFQRIERMNTYFRFRQPAPWLEEIDYLLVSKRMLRIPKASQSDWRPDRNWKKIRENDECLLLARIHRPQNTSPVRSSLEEPP